MSKDIPLSELNKGFEIGVNHVQEMLSSSKILFDAKHYTMSISLSILTLEEITKIYDISECINTRKTISEEEWKKMSRHGSHNKKLTKLFEDAQRQVKEMGEDHHKRVQKLAQKLGESERFDYQKITGKDVNIDLLKNLNIIKKECFYLDWKNEQWKTFETTFKPKGLSALAEVLYYQNLGVTLSIMIQSTTPRASLNEQSQKFKAYRDNPFRKKSEEIRKIEQSKEFKEKVTIANAILKDYSNIL